MTPGETLGHYLGAFVDELSRAGVQNVVVCPGSRSTPLALTLAARTTPKHWLHYDERSAGFFALGMARASRRPVALVCTSGTAAANFLPAIVEAFFGRVPLLVLTADRPPELRGVGAAQTIDQVRLYGQHVKWSVDALLPEASVGALRYVRTLANRSAATAVNGPAGPVHINFPFREPLIPDATAIAQEATSRRCDDARYVAVTAGPREPASIDIDQLLVSARTHERGLIVLGPIDDRGLPSAAARLAEVTGFPILADPLSGARFGAHDRSRVIDAYDACLRSTPWSKAHRPELVLRFGAIPTSKPLNQFIESADATVGIVIDGDAGWNEPTALASHIIHADPTRLCDAVSERWGVPRATSWESSWQAANRGARDAIDRALADVAEMHEGKVVAELAAALPGHAVLWVGSSMPVRDVDTFMGSQAHEWRVLSNRGANGIDGVVSGALGASAVSSVPTVLLIGDLSFFHDLNGLLAARLHRLDLTVVLVNNDGGGIFSFLPQADDPTHFEEFFGTPHGLDFQSVVEMYGGRYAHVETWPNFRSTMSTALTRRGLNVIEIRTNRARNVTQHRELWPLVHQAILRSAILPVDAPSPSGATP